MQYAIEITREMYRGFEVSEDNVDLRDQIVRR